MEKTYSLSKLFAFDEFDAQKCSARYDKKEAYFAILSRFTLDTETILDRFGPDVREGKTMDARQIARNVERLQRMLLDIGAVNLAWDIQNLSPHLASKNYDEYLKGLDQVFIKVRELRAKIIAAEKPDGGFSAEYSDGEPAPESQYQSKARRDVFEMLLMLIDNFEFDSAAKLADSIMVRHYTAEMDEALNAVSKALKEFNSDRALEEAQKLRELSARMDSGEEAEKRRILAIDDMPDVLRTVKAMLKNKYTVFGVTNYDSAIEFLRSNTADLILLDIEMPGLDGFAMMQLFRKIPNCADTPIVFLTSNVSVEHVNMARSLGASDFIKKPVDLAVLVQKLESALSGK